MRDRLLAGALILVSAVVYWGTLDLPPPSFEPLGSAAFPRIVSVLMAILAIPLLVKPTPSQPRTAETPANGEAIRQTPMMAVWLMVASVLLAIAMQSRVVSFAVSAIVFLVVVMSILTRFDRRGWLATAIIAPIVGFGLEYVLTRVFVIDLP